MGLSKIEIWSRGKNRDVYGNPYWAYKVVLTYNYVSYFETITITKGMSGGSSSEHACLTWALQGIKEALGLEFNPHDERIIHHHKHVYRDADLEHPETWKV